MQKWLPSAKDFGVRRGVSLWLSSPVELSPTFAGPDCFAGPGCLVPRKAGATSGDDVQKTPSQSVGADPCAGVPRCARCLQRAAAAQGHAVPRLTRSTTRAAPASVLAVICARRSPAPRACSATTVGIYPRGRSLAPNKPLCDDGLAVNDTYVRQWPLPRDWPVHRRHVPPVRRRRRVRRRRLLCQRQDRARASGDDSKPRSRRRYLHTSPASTPACHGRRLHRLTGPFARRGLSRYVYWDAACLGACRSTSMTRRALSSGASGKVPQ